MADGTFPSLISKDNDINAVDNAIFVQLSDGTSAVSITSGSLDVNITNTSIDVTATQLDIDDLRAGVGTGEDNVLIFANTAKDGTGTDYVPIVDTDGKLIISNPGGTEYTEDVATPATIVGSAVMIERDDALSALTPVEGDWVSLRSNARGALWVELDLTNNVKVDIASQSLTAIKISKDANANSETNPIYVKPVDTVASGEEIHEYDTSTVTAGNTANHDYTVSGAIFFLKSVIVSASGNAKFEIQVGALASLVTKAVGFLTGREGDTKQVIFNPAIEVPVTGTGTVRIVVTNRQNQSQDIYTTIIGNDV